MIQNIVIEDLQTIDPPEYLTSNELENLLSPLYQRLKLPEGRLEMMTGIKRRGFWPAQVLPSTIATSAAQMMESSQLDEVDLLINCSVCRDQHEPATSTFIHKNLKLGDHVLSFDLSNACLGLLSGLKVATQFILNKQARKVLLVSGENSGKLLFDTVKFLNQSENLNRKQIKSSIASLTIGSAGAAVLVSHESYAKMPLFKIKSFAHHADADASDLCRGGNDSGQLLMHTDSETLLKRGIECAKANWKKFNFEFDKVITHQVGSVHREQVLSALGIKEGLDFSIFENFGNSGSAAIFSALKKACQSGFIQARDRVALLGIGSGLQASFAGVDKL